jgi:hypothetical protein
MNAQTSPLNLRGPDIKFPPNSEGRQAIVTSRPNAGWKDGPLVDNWVEAPKEKTYVLGSINGIIQWIETESCDE